MARDDAFTVDALKAWRLRVGERVYLRKTPRSVTWRRARTGAVVLVHQSMVKVSAPYASVRPTRVTLHLNDVRPYRFPFESVARDEHDK